MKQWLALTYAITADITGDATVTLDNSTCHKNTYNTAVT